MSGKIGFITVGQSPRIDVVPEMAAFLPETEILEAGALDGLTREAIEKFKPDSGDLVLVSRLNDGTHVTFGEKHIFPYLQNCIDSLERKGVSHIVFICTGEFPYEFRSSVPLIFPSAVLKAVARPFLHKNAAAVIVPDKQQVDQMYTKWSEIKNLSVYVANPYDGLETFINRTKELKKQIPDVDLILLDCIGYTLDMKRSLREAAGKPVIAPRSALARLLGEILE